MSEEKPLWAHITDWFRELKTLGIAGLLVGLGFVLVFIEAILYTNNASVSFYVIVIIGGLMILAGVYVKVLELKERKS